MAAIDKKLETSIILMKAHLDEANYALSMFDLSRDPSDEDNSYALIQCEEELILALAAVRKIMGEAEE